MHEEGRRDETPAVSVITNVRNEQTHIGEAIESVLAQTFTDWEYIIVDDASDDDTSAIVERYASADPRISLVRRQKCGGPYVAANEGIRLARGRHIARLDADDVALPERLERQLAFLERHRLRACASEITLLADGRREPMRTASAPTLPGALKWRACVREMFMPSTTLIETAALRELGCFRELPLSQDLRLWCDLTRKGWLGFITDPLVLWRTHSSQLSAKRHALQESLAMDVLRDHICALSGEDWSASDVYDLRWVAFRDVGLLRGRAVIGRFERLWQRDTAMTEEERAQVRDLTRWLRQRHLRVTAKHRLSSMRLGRALVRSRRSVRRSQA